MGLSTYDPATGTWTHRNVDGTTTVHVDAAKKLDNPAAFTKSEEAKARMRAAREAREALEKHKTLTALGLGPDDAYVLIPNRERSAKIMAHSQFPKTIQFLRDEGLDPETMAVNGITAEGYQELVLDDKGNRIMDSGGTFVTRFVEWPGPTFGRMVIEFMREDGRDARGQGKVLLDAPHDLDRVVLLRRQYDMAVYDEEMPGSVMSDIAAAWLDAEQELTPDERREYEELYERVSEGLKRAARPGRRLQPDQEMPVDPAPFIRLPFHMSSPPTRRAPILRTTEGTVFVTPQRRIEFEQEGVVIETHAVEPHKWYTIDFEKGKALNFREGAAGF